MEGTNFLPSLLKGFTAKESTAISWTEVMNYLTDGSLLELTQRYRQTGDWLWKSRLLSITPACQLSGTGKEAADVVGLTGVAMADFDHIDPARIEEVRQQVNADAHTFLSYVTVSGDGLRVLYRYEGTDYAAAFLAGNCHYADLIGHPFDEKCSNVNRLSALCHDAQAYINEKASILTPALSLKGEGEEKSELASEGGENFKDPKDFKAPAPDPVAYAVRTVERHGETYIRGNRHTYLMKCVCMMNRLGVSQQEAEQWALTFDLGEREIRTLVKSVYSLYAAQHGTYSVPEWTKTKTLTKTQTLTKTGQNLQTDKLTEASHAHTGARESDVTELKVNSLPDYQWPCFIQQMVDCGDSKAQRDVILLAVITVLGAMLGKLVRFKYSHRFWFPSLQLFVVAPPASGKSVISWVRRLAEPMHDKFMTAYDKAKALYDRAKAAYDNAGKERANMECPKQPVMQMFLIAGNNSSTGILENLADAHQHTALICEAEADTISAAILSDYGNWDDTLRKVHDHDRLSYNRRTNKEYRQIPNPFLSVLISGTPAQVKPLIPSAENGLFSRQIFATLPAINDFVDQFGNGDEMDYDALFTQWGREWTEQLEQIRTQMTCVELRLNQKQRDSFNQHFSMLFHHAGATRHNHHMKSSVAREAINVLRMMSVVAFFRALEDDKGFTIPADIPQENVKDGTCTRYELAITDSDFQAVLSLSEPLYHNASEILSLLPSTEAVRTAATPVEMLLTSLPLQFTRAEAVTIGAELGITRDNVDQLLHRLCDDQKLLKAARGKYEFAFPCNVKGRACVREETV